jgi:hypothetical protein
MESIIVSLASRAPESPQLLLPKWRPPRLPSRPGEAAPFIGRRPPAPTPRALSIFRSMVTGWRQLRFLYHRPRPTPPWLMSPDLAPLPPDLPHPSLLVIERPLANAMWTTLELRHRVDASVRIYAPSPVLCQLHRWVTTSRRIRSPLL